MKKILSVILVIIMAISIAPSALAAKAEEKTVLQFDKDGKFKILILSDLQDGYPIEEAYKVFVCEALDKVQPNLVVFLGDNVMRAKDETEESYWLGYDEVMEPLVERNIPFSFVFGNHDDEAMPDIPIEEKFEKYQSYKGCLAKDAVPSLHGCGTHNIEILSSDKSKIAFNLWFMDCGDYEPGRTGKKAYYDYIHKDQLDWYQNVSRQLEEKTGGKVPSLMFQHIIPAEIAKKVMITLPFNIGDTLGHFVMDDGSTITYIPNIFGFKSGSLAEAASPARKTDGQWDAMAECGDVLATFFGHDHINFFRTTLNGIDAINVPGCSYHSYYSKKYQGAMLVTLDESDLSTYKDEMIYSTDLALEKGSKLPGLTRSKFNYRFNKILRHVSDVLLYPIHKISNFLAKLFSKDH